MSLPMLEIAIGLSFVYLLLSLVCTIVNEMIAGWRKTRAAFLSRGIEQLLGGDMALKQKLYEHPLIESLSPGGSGSRPSYIPAEHFATALTDILTGDGKSPSDLGALEQGVQKTASKKFQASMTALLNHPGMDAAAAKERLEHWFDDGMDRVSGWYKRDAQRNVFLLACLMTLSVNADTIHIANRLWVRPTLQAAVVEEARVRSQKERPEELLPLVEYPNPQDPTASAPVQVPSDQSLSENDSKLLGELAGWSDDLAKRKGSGFWAYFEGTWLYLMMREHLLGWILTALAVSLGAPIWFDTLNRFMNIRHAGRAPDEPRDKSRKAAESSSRPKEGGKSS